MAGNPYASGLPETLTVRLGRQVTLPLRAALGSGYGWTADVQGTEVEATVRTQGPGGPIDPTAPPPLAAARQTLEITGRRPGAAQVRLRLVRSWSPDRPIAAHTLQVSVADDDLDP
jgi:hypothetical protein